MKDPLQILLVSLAKASSVELNEAIFAHPDLGIIEAMYLTVGPERETEILAAVSASLKTPLLEEEQLVVDEAVLNVDPIKLDSLISAHKALPLGWHDYGGERQLRLVMANPLDQKGKDAFHELYNAPARFYIARERAIKNASVRHVSALRLAAREAVKSQADGVRSGAEEYVEDPEVRKAIQQIVATAVKHGVEKVEIGLDRLFTHAEFIFEDEQRSAVDISVKSAAFAGGLLRRGQITERGENTFEAACRVDFKASSVNCLLKCYRAVQSPADGANPPFPWQALAISDFSVERPDDPNFWLSISEEGSFELRTLFREQEGIFVAVGKDESARRLAIQAVSESYSDIQLVEALEDLVSGGEILPEFSASHVLVGCGEEDIFAAVRTLKTLLKEGCKAIRGVFSYCHIPRLCEFCAVASSPSQEELGILPDYVPLDTDRLRGAKGCAACGERGILGFVGVCSVLNCTEELWARILSASSDDEVAQLIARSNLKSLWESGAMCVESGSVSIAAVLKRLPRPPAAYERLRQALSRTAGNRVVGIKGKPSSIAERKAAGRKVSQISQQGVQPVSGAAAFSVHPQAKQVSGEGKASVLNHFKEGLEESAGIELLSARTGDGPLLLVIDDDADQRAILRRVFELEGYSVEVAADGIDGIVSANRLKPDLIIVDFMMPDLDGRETIRRLKKNSQTTTIPIIALTAYSDPDVEYGLLKAGADDFCAKSVAKRVLLKRIEKLISNN
jgi:CheY-like chemotaxis protein